MTPIITLHQPYASLLFVAGGKVNETRSRRPPAKFIGSRVGIHAALKEPEVDPALAAICVMFFGPTWATDLPRGSIIGTAIMGAPVETSRLAGGGAAHLIDWLAGDYGPGRYFYPMQDRRALASPIPAKGQQGWWTFDLGDGA